MTPDDQNADRPPPPERSSRTIMVVVIVMIALQIGVTVWGWVR